MIQFKSISDLSKLPSNDPAYTIIDDLSQKLLVTTGAMVRPYDPEADGWIVLIEEKDIDRPLTEIWGDDAYSLIEVPWEGVTRDESGQFFICIFLANNQWGLTAILPDRDFLTGELRECIEAHLAE
jgi:hypothetical protein